MKSWLIMAWLVAVSSLAFSQDLASIGKKDPVSVNGYLSSNFLFNATTVPNSYRLPFSYFLNGNLTFNIYGVSVPLSFNWSNQQFNFLQPFNRYSIHPTYKGITAHLGYTSVSFSPYTVSGHLFLGGAVDVKQGKWMITAFSGRLLKEARPDSLLNVPGNYERWGYGIKAGLTQSATTMSFSIFKARDKITAITEDLVNRNVFPQENLVVGTEFSQKLTKQLAFRGEWAGSSITSNTLADLSNEKVAINLGDFYSARTTSAFYQAYKGSLNFQQKGYSIGTSYERIDPGYKTLGAYFFNNDLENITLNASAQLFNNKVNIAANGGVQRDNLDGSKSSNMTRTVGSVNMNIVPTDRLTLQGSYSNFYSFTNIRTAFLTINQTTPFNTLDTLNYTQLSQSINASATCMLERTKEKMKSLMVSGNMQNATDRQGERAANNAGSKFYNSMVAYNLGLQQKQITFSFAFNYSKTESPVFKTDILGPVVSANKMLMKKKLRINASSAWNTSLVNGDTQSQIFTTRINSALQLQKKHQFQLGVAHLQRTSRAATTPNSSDLTINIGYNYQFSAK
ncbi:MAG: hypothetical protein K2U26_15350 [Cyclobacteriaceae bacterium]|nr:hypothetical protein [Cyclobacteriaceae bacterium]